MSAEPGACFAACSSLSLLGALLLFGCASPDAAPPPAGTSPSPMPAGADAPPPLAGTDAPPPTIGTAASEGAEPVVPSRAHDGPMQGEGLVFDGEDAPLPERDEVPAFLGPRRIGGEWLAHPPPTGDGAPSSAEHWSSAEQSLPASAEPSLAELLQHVRFTEEGEEDEGSFASVIAADGDGASGEGERAPDVGTTHRSGAKDASSATDSEPPSPNGAPAAEGDDPCAGIRAALAEYQAYLERIGAERTAFAYVESAEDASALRLLQAMRRCAEFPDDPDCKAPPMEVELRDVEPPRHTYESWPTELLGEKKDPDEIAHDPRIRELRHQLERCQRQQKAQPLLE